MSSPNERPPQPTAPPTAAPPPTSGHQLPTGPQPATQAPGTAGRSLLRAPSPGNSGTGIRDHLSGRTAPSSGQFSAVDRLPARAPQTGHSDVAAVQRSGAAAPGPTPAGLDTSTPSIGVSGDQADVRFREAGRASAHERPIAPHLDQRLAGLDTPPRPRRWPFGRRGANGMDNEPSDGLSRPIHSPRRISVVGMKGGVGKTTLSILTATTIARMRQMPVLLLDSDTTYGSLMLRTGLAPMASADDLATMGDPGSLQLLSSSVSRTTDGVWVVPSGRTPAQSAAFGEQGYVAAVRAVYRYFPVMITDCGAGLAGPLMHRVISASHSLVIATAPSMDSLLATYNTLEWLASIGYESLAMRSIVAITNVNPKTIRINLEETRKRFRERCHEVVVIPSDPHLQSGSAVDYDALDEPALEAARSLAATALGAALEAP
ncbi:MinD/ParA family protein [Blastococcus sp. Marseille-P5729]|uniref:MinD/ParA family ATP-binding protein n=1 Tax=Blastococcus sp. Marseille-P5729 TaxID=2086582 RepID=UPI00131DD567|nr:MinD/ParA family protein [Blastococcus sp. Marseille-P5729]